MTVFESSLKHEPTEVVVKSGIKVMWDLYILTDIEVSHNRPDIVIYGIPYMSVY